MQPYVVLLSKLQYLDRTIDTRDFKYAALKNYNISLYMNYNISLYSYTFT